MTSNRIYSIYKITNTVNGLVYIGQTRRNPQTRWKEHKNDSKNRPRNKFHRSLGENLDGVFTFEVIDISPKSQEELDNLEKFYIKLYNCCTLDGENNGYNLDRGGNSVSSEIISKNNYKRVINGTNPFCGDYGSSISKNTQSERFSNGTHHNLIIRTCPFCEKIIKGPGYFHHHGDKCKLNPNRIPQTVRKQKKKWTVSFPDGNTEIISNLKIFCDIHGLSKDQMGNLALGKTHTPHRGFLCKKYQDK
jgi:hypothetical protein